MKDWVSLELGIHRRTEKTYALEARCTLPPETDVFADTAVLRLDREELARLAVDTDGYGKALSGFVFAEEDTRELLTRARGHAEEADVPLRLRLFIGPSAPELHTLRWETLRDPADDSLLVTNQRVLLSRYATSQDARRLSSRSQTDLRALIVAASPADIGDYGGLSPFDVQAEVDLVKPKLGFTVADDLTSPGATLNALLARLQEGRDILYIVCHGTVDRDDPYLWLEEGEEGKAVRVAGADLVARIADLEQRPRLVVLASCQSAGVDGGGVPEANGFLSAIGPLLARAGVPAVLGMHGSVSQQTASHFMGTFFTELAKDGVIDRAVAVARTQVLNQPDWWVPVLLTRLRNCQLWYAPELTVTEGGEARERWAAITDNLRFDDCLPILGPGAVEPVLGPRAELARQLARRHQFPLSEEDRDHLPKIAEYVAVRQQAAKPYVDFIESIQARVERLLGGPEGVESAIGGAKDVIDEVEEQTRSLCGDHPRHTTRLAMEVERAVLAAGCRRWEQDPTDPLWVLANQPLSVYVTTDPSPLLAGALVAAGKTPCIRLCPWYEPRTSLGEAAYALPSRYDPTPKRPLVYHLFGRLIAIGSMVLKEEDYFGYLTGIQENRAHIAGPVGTAFSEKGLLFLGFQMEDWDFRVALCHIRPYMNKRDRGGDLGGVAHVAVQVEPQDDRMVEPVRARRFVSTFFQHHGVSIYWGSAADFARDLQLRTQGGHGDVSDSERP